MAKSPAALISMAVSFSLPWRGWNSARWPPIWRSCSMRGMAWRRRRATSSPPWTPNSTVLPAPSATVERIVAATAPARHKLVILDACRDNAPGEICPNLKHLSFTRIEPDVAELSARDLHAVRPASPRRRTAACWCDRAICRRPWTSTLHRSPSRSGWPKPTRLMLTGLMRPQVKWIAPAGKAR